jgi:CHASE3 domain sensor protein
VVVRKVITTDIKILEDTLALQRPEPMQQAARLISKGQ